MGIRLYDSAWVTVEGRTSPLQALRVDGRPDLFHIGDHIYNVDGVSQDPDAPGLITLLSLADLKARGLVAGYARDLPEGFDWSEGAKRQR